MIRAVPEAPASPCDVSFPPLSVATRTRCTIGLGGAAFVVVVFEVDGEVVEYVLFLPFEPHPAAARTRARHARRRAGLRTAIRW
jgi:hypothetical protein